MIKRFLGSLILALLVVGVSILPVFATTTTVQLQDTFNMACNVSVRDIDGVARPRVTTATLICTDNTVTSKGVITNATLTIPGYTALAVVGYVGRGSNPYLTLAGATADTALTLAGRVHAHGAVVQYITGSVNGFGTHSQGALGSTGTGTSEWSSASPYGGTVAALLTAEADPGSQYVQFIPPTRIHLSDMDTITSGWSLAYNQSAVAYGPQVELRFTAPNNINPDGVGHVDVTLLPHQGVGTAAWATANLTSAGTMAIYYGNDPFDGTAFSDSGVALLNTVEAAINAEAVMQDDGTIYTCGNWDLTRVRVELWEGGVRTCYIDDVTIKNTVYSFEPVFFTGNFKAIP